MTSNLPFARWGDVFGDLIIVSAMIDRIVRHANMINLKAPATGSKGTAPLQLRHTKKRLQWPFSQSA